MTRVNVAAARKQVARILEDSRAFERKYTNQTVTAGVFYGTRNATTEWRNPDTLEARIRAAEAPSLAHG